MKYNPVELILKKRNGETLTEDQMKYFVESYIKGEIPEYQMSAFLMSTVKLSWKVSTWRSRRVRSSPWWDLRGWGSQPWSA